jgi:hypothetical protein
VNKRKKKSITNTSVDEDEENCEESLGINDDDLIENDGDVGDDIAEVDHLNGDVEDATTTTTTTTTTKMS